ncbi:Protein Dok-7, partial [Operophtera brumata]
MHSHDAQSRLSIASRSGSVMDKRFSDTSSIDDGFHPSHRSASPCWGAPASQTMHCLSDHNSSMDSDDDRIRRPTSLPRCSSCIGKISHLTRSSTVGTPGSMMSPVWTMDNIMEKRCDSDRASIYSRSSGSASEYSVPRSSCLLDKSFDRASPVGCCTPTVPAKVGCQCWQQKPCCCRKKLFNGPYENYDVPKTPMPLIQRCACTTETKTNSQPDTSLTETNEEPHMNYVNVTPITIKPELDYGNYTNVDLASTLEKFESSLQILRSAGFSQEELEGLEDIPEHDDDISTATTNTVHQTEFCDLNFMQTELEISSSSNSNKNCSDNISRISHVSDPTQHSESDNTLSTRRSSSADFTRRHDDEYGIHSQICFTPSVLRKANKNERINAPLQSLEIVETKDKVFKPQVKENAFVTKFRDVVKIRRSASVPSKSDKNRDSSSSNDSGVSTGSLKHHKGDFDFEMPITNAKSMKKHLKSKQMRSSMTPVHVPKSNSSDPLKNLTFQFEEVATLTKSNSSCDVSADRHVTRPRSGKEYASIDRAALATLDVTN